MRFGHETMRCVLQEIQRRTGAIGLQMQIDWIGGSHFITVSWDDVIANPNWQKDDFAAAYLSTDVDTYREWVRLDGTAFCGAKNSKGRACGNTVGHIQRDFEDWYCTHRSEYCHVHKE